MSQSSASVRPWHSSVYLTNQMRASAMKHFSRHFCSVLLLPCRCWSSIQKRTLAQTNAHPQHYSFRPARSPAAIITVCCRPDHRCLDGSFARFLNFVIDITVYLVSGSMTREQQEPSTRLLPNCSAAGMRSITVSPEASAIPDGSRLGQAGRITHHDRELLLFCWAQLEY